MWEVEERPRVAEKSVEGGGRLHKLKGAADLFRRSFCTACTAGATRTTPYRDNSECHTNCYIGKAWKELEEALTKAKEVLEDEQA